MTSGVRMAHHGHAIPFAVIGEEVCPGADGSGASNQIPLRVDGKGHVKPDLPRYAIPLQPSETFGNETSVTL
jgi:hypothetical protein